MSRLTPVLKLNTVNRFAGTGMVITVIAVSGLLSLLVGAVLHLVLDAPAEAVAAGLRHNQVLYWWPGIALLIHAAQVIGTSTPLALALGATRRSMWWGSVVTFVLLALLAAAVLTAFLLVEGATGGWFLGLPAFDVALFAAGSPARAFLVAFLLYLGAQMVGAVFATVYVRGGPVALTLSIIGTVVTTLAVLVWVAATAPGSGAAAGTGATGFPEGLVLLLAAAAPVLLALLGWGLYRRVSVR
ncbi:hypothetical protein [Kocuria nitroreducens]|uniref:hypothetical protein n=1 Tax=Kocuria nitroreducens TaxID=3058914 RepID=UPI0036DF1AD9